MPIDTKEPANRAVNIPIDFHKVDAFTYRAFTQGNLIALLTRDSENSLAWWVSDPNGISLSKENPSPTLLDARKLVRANIDNLKVNSIPGMHPRNF